MIILYFVLISSIKLKTGVIPLLCTVKMQKMFPFEKILLLQAVIDKIVQLLQAVIDKKFLMLQAVIDKIVSNCSCLPSFSEVGDKPFCRGPGIPLFQIIFKEKCFFKQLYYFIMNIRLG